MDVIQNKNAVTTVDIAMKVDALVTHQIFANKQNKVEHVGGVHANKQSNAIVLASEALGLLDSRMSVVKNTKRLYQGKIEIYNNNRKIVNQTGEEMLKESKHTREAGSMIE